MDAGDQRQRRSQRPSYQQSLDNDSSQQLRVLSSANSARASYSPAVGPRESLHEGQTVPSSASLQPFEGYGYAPSHYSSQQTFESAYTHPSHYSQHPAQRGPSYSQNSQPIPYESVDPPMQAPSTANLAFNHPPSFQQRQPAAVESLSQQFRGAQYHNSGVSQATLASEPYQPVSLPQNLPYIPSADLGRSQLGPGYVLGDVGLQNMVDTRQPQQQAPPDLLTSHDQLLRQANTFTSQGRIVEAKPILTRLSTGLVNHALTLGMFQICPQGLFICR